MRSLQRMARFLQPYRWVLGIGLFTVILPVAMELIVPRMLQYIIDQGIRSTNMAVVIRGSLVMLGAALVGALATVGQGVYRAWLSQGIAYDLRTELFTHVQTLSFANLDHMQTGQLMTRLSSDVDLVRLFLSAGLALLLRAVLMISGSMVMLVITDRQLSLVMLVVLPITGAVIWTVMRAARPLFITVQQKLAGLNTLVQENLAGVQVVKAFVIAHRLSTIRKADQVLVVNDRRIIERGTHDQLLARGGFYHDLYLSQYRQVQALAARA